MEKNKQKRIYMDHAAAAPMDKRVRKAMEPYWTENFGNPNAIYKEGLIARSAIENAREDIAKILGARAKEIIFTNGGTESDNLAILGIAREAKQNFSRFTLPRNGAGSDASQNFASPRLSAAFPLFHTDACQAPGYLDINVERLGVDLMTINGSKIYGPKGIGLLYAKNGIKLEPLLYGGEQERKLRPGTENVPAIIGLAEALKIAEQEREKESARLVKLRDYFINRLLGEIPKTVLNGHPIQRLPNNINVSILDAEGESIVLYLDEAGAACSTGSACTSESLEPSHVILAIGKPHAYAHGAMRFSLGRSTTKKDIDYVMKVLPDIIKKLRMFSPVNIKI